MDLVFEYAAVYGGPPRPTDSWALFVQGVRRAARFTARRLLAAILGPTFAIASLNKEGGLERQAATDRLDEQAFGRKRPLILGQDARPLRGDG